MDRTQPSEQRDLSGGGSAGCQVRRMLSPFVVVVAVGGPLGVGDLGAWDVWGVRGAVYELPFWGG